MAKLEISDIITTPGPHWVDGQIAELVTTEGIKIVAFPGGEDRVYIEMCQTYLEWSSEKCCFVNSAGITEYDMKQEEVTRLCHLIDPNWT